MKLSSSTVTDTLSRYYSNKNSASGGVFYLDGSTSFTATSCLFYENSATNAGTIQLAD